MELSVGPRSAESIRMNYGRGKHILEFLLGTVVRAFRPTPFKAVYEAATCDPRAWRRPLSK
jgi:hypothetical protein